MSYVGVILTFVFVNNLVLSQLLGVCPFVGVPRRTGESLVLGCAVTFVLSLSALATWAVYRMALVPLRMEYLQTVTFVLVIVGLVRLLEKGVQRVSPPLRRALGVYLPMLSTNCAVLGMALIAVRSGYGALESFVAGIAAGAGFLLALVIMSSIREKLDAEWVPHPLRGVPITFVTAGLMALAFLAFDRALLQSLLG